MNKGIIFIVGVAIGASATYVTLKKKYEDIMAEEIQAIKAMYKEKSEEASDEVAEEVSEPIKDIDKEKIAIDARTKPDLIKHATELSNKNNYVNYSKSDNKAEKKNEKKPYEIQFDEYGEIEDYEAITLYYYSDGVVADENDEEVEYPEMLIGEGYEEYFETSGEDSLYIRNEHISSDYEVLRSAKTYAEAIGETYPYNMMED